MKTTTRPVMAASKRRPASKDSGLDALFDYSRVAPTIILEDSDSDDDVRLIDKIEVKTRKRCTSKLDPAVRSCSDKAVANAPKKMDWDDDWLTPPIKAGVRQIQLENPDLLKIRLQREELLMLSEQLATDKMQCAELETRAACAVRDSPEDTSKTSQKQQVDSSSISREKIVLQLQEQSGKSHSLKIFLDDRFDKLFRIYAESIAKRPVSEISFRFDGAILDPLKTPKDLELEDEDMIEVNLKPVNNPQPVHVNPHPKPSNLKVGEVQAQSLTLMFRQFSVNGGRAVLLPQDVGDLIRL